MKKLFVSVPMRNRTEEEIKESIIKMKKIAEVYESEPLELLDSYIEGNIPENVNQAIFYLSKSIEKLSEADIFIGIDEPWDWNGCFIESTIASRYGIKMYRIPADLVIKDYRKLLNESFVPANADTCTSSDEIIPRPSC